MLANTQQVYELISTIRHDSLCLNFPWNSAANNGQPSLFMLLPHHFDRLRAAAALHGWQDAGASLSWALFQLTCQRAVEAYDGPAKGGPLKVSVHPHLQIFLNTPFFPFFTSFGSYSIELVPSQPPSRPHLL
jgi:hypothetical protein